MEKTELFYIVIKGTNDRVLTLDHIPLIVRPGSVDTVLDKCTELAEQCNGTTYECEDISIEEYERIFTEPAEW